MSTLCSRRCFAGLLVALLAWASCHTAAQAQEGLLVGQKFQVPVLVAGKTVLADAVVDAQGIMTVTVVLKYQVIRQQGDVVTPPGPGPGPGPVTKAIAVYLIYEKDDPSARTPAFAAVKTDKAWRASADAASMPQHVWDKDEPRLQKLPGVLGTANARGLPCVVFAFADGTGKAEPVPKDAAGMLALVQKYGGAKP